MTTTIDGNSGVIFPDTSTQAISALTGSRVASAKMPAGAILQVVQSVKTDTYNTNATSYTAITGMSATITPTSATSKILVALSMNVGVASDTYHAYFQLYKNGSVLNAANGTSGLAWPCFVHQNGTNYRNMYTHSMNYLDSPATTSATTYAIYGANQTSSTGFTINYCNLSDSWTPNGISTITLMEIAA